MEMVLRRMNMRMTVILTADEERSARAMGRGIAATIVQMRYAKRKKLLSGSGSQLGWSLRLVFSPGLLATHALEHAERFAALRVQHLEK